MVHVLSLLHACIYYVLPVVESSFLQSVLCTVCTVHATCSQQATAANTIKQHTSEHHNNLTNYRIHSFIHTNKQEHERPTEQSPTHSRNASSWWLCNGMSCCSVFVLLLHRLCLEQKHNKILVYSNIDSVCCVLYINLYCLLFVISLSNRSAGFSNSQLQVNHHTHDVSIFEYCTQLNCSTTMKCNTVQKDEN